MAWYNPFSWGEKNLDDFRTDLGSPYRVQDAQYLRGALRHGMNRLGDGYANQDAIRQRQLQTADRLTAMMNGQQAGAGELAVQRQANRNAAQQMGMAANARGGDAALMQREAMRNVGNIGTDAAGQAQIAAMQDQQMAAGQLGQVLGAARGQDLQAQQEREAAKLAYMQQVLGLSQAEIDARRQYDALRLQQNLGLAGIDTSGYGAQLMGLAGQAGIAYATSGGSEVGKMAGKQ